MTPAEYRKTDAYRAKQRRYYGSAKCREATRKRQAKYRATEAGAMMIFLYRTSARGRLRDRLAHERMRRSWA